MKSERALRLIESGKVPFRGGGMPGLLQSSIPYRYSYNDYSEV